MTEILVLPRAPGGLESALITVVIEGETTVLKDFKNNTEVESHYHSVLDTFSYNNIFR